MLQEKVTEIVDVGRVLAAGGVYDQFGGDDTDAYGTHELEGTLV